MSIAKSTHQAGRRNGQALCCEVVRSDSDAFLVNARHQACRYETAEGRVLPPGYYLSLWPEASGPRYGREASFFGPFATKASAGLLQTSALYLGVAVRKEAAADAEWAVDWWPQREAVPALLGV